MRKRQIPAVPRSAVEHARVEFDSSVKENLEILTGRRGSVIEELGVNASATDVVAKINEIIKRLQ